VLPESQALVGDEGFAGVLPLAAAGPGEPLGTAAAVLGLMAMWRSFYAVYLDTWVWASARWVWLGLSHRVWVRGRGGGVCSGIEG